MEEGILQLLYSGDETNIELALQLIKGLAASETKDKLNKRLKDLKCCADTFGFVDIQSILKAQEGSVFQAPARLIGPHLAAMPKTIINTLFISQSYKAPDADLQNCLPMLSNINALYLRDALPAQLNQCWHIDSLKVMYAGLRGDYELNPNSPNCPNLRALELSTIKGQISVGPKISNLQTLRELSINARDRGVMLCPELTTLAQLADFSSEALKNQDSAFQILAACPNLKNLEAAFHGINRPPNILATSSLQSLTVKHYGLDTFFDLPRTLERLFIENAQALTEIPQIITQLPHLRGLSISGIPLKKLPDFIFGLPDQLEALYISSTDMTNTQINYWTERLTRHYPKATISIDE